MQRKRRLYCHFILLAGVLLSNWVTADTEEGSPLWELGVGVAALSQAHYFGAADNRALMLPVPYFKYRGKVLRADREGIRARLFTSERLSLGITGSGSFGADSDDDEARRGMPDLDVLGEFGPNLRVDLVDSDNLHLQLQLPIRAAFSFGDKLGEYQGWTSNPRLVASMHADGWDYETSFGPIFSDQNYHAYMYDVAPEFSLPERPEYTASSGYTALRMGFNMSRYLGKNLHINGFLRYFNLQGAENADSPLFRREHNYWAGVTVSWVLQRSRQTVDNGD